MKHTAKTAFILILMFIVGNIALAIAVTAFEVIRILAFGKDSGVGYAVGAVTGIAIILLLALTVRKFIFKETLPPIFSAPNNIDLKKILLWFGFGCGLVAAVLVMFYVSGMGSFTGFDSTNLVIGLVASVSISFLAGINEEIVFRYFMYGFARRHMRPVIAASFVGVLFGIAHINQVNNAIEAVTLIIAATGVSLLFSAIYEATKNIWAAAAVHTAWDVFVLQIGFVFVNQYNLDKGSKFPYGGFEVTEPNMYLSGGSFGIEQSIFAMTLYYVAAAVVWYFGIRQKTSQALS